MACGTQKDKYCRLCPLASQYLSYKSYNKIQQDESGDGPSQVEGFAFGALKQELEDLLVHFEILLMELPENSISKIEKCLILASKVLGAIWYKLRSSNV